MQRSRIITEYIDALARELRFDVPLSRRVRREVEDHLWESIANEPNSDPIEAQHRAIARFGAGDTPGAIADLQATLQHEPRSFAAFQTLSAIAEARKDWKGAYEAWQKVMEIDPKTPGGEERLKDLRRHALGEEA